MSDECYYTVQIPVDAMSVWERTLKVRDILLDRGITFDTGTNGLVLDWELDWSLVGGTAEDVRSALDQHGISYNVIIRSKEHDNAVVSNNE